MKFQSKCNTFHSRKCIWKYRLRNGDHFVRGRWVNPWIIWLWLVVDLRLLTCTWKWLISTLSTMVLMNCRAVLVSSSPAWSGMANITSIGCSPLQSGRDFTWWRHQMEKNIRVTGPLSGKPPVTGGFPSQRPVTQSFDVFLWSVPEQMV